MDPRPSNAVLVFNAAGIVIFTLLFAGVAFELAGALIPFRNTLFALLGFLSGILAVTVLVFGGWAFWHFVGRHLR